jgi:hypothetical protein
MYSEIDSIRFSSSGVAWRSVACTVGGVVCHDKVIVHVIHAWDSRWLTGRDVGDVRETIPRLNRTEQRRAEQSKAEQTTATRANHAQHTDTTHTGTQADS